VEKERSKKISKFLSCILRYKPGKIGIELNKFGWTDVKTLLDKSKPKFYFDFNELKHIVQNDNKNRFELSEDFCEVRARSGHSINVELKMKEVKPPTFL